MTAASMYSPRNPPACCHLLSSHNKSDATATPPLTASFLAVYAMHELHCACHKPLLEQKRVHSCFSIHDAMLHPWSCKCSERPKPGTN